MEDGAGKTVAAGSGEEATDEDALAERLKAAFKSAFEAEPDFIARAPGRINLIGEHTDYNGGFVLPVAIDRTVLIAVRAVGDSRQVDMLSVNYSNKTSFDLGNIEKAEDEKLGWSNYIRGVAWALADRKMLDIRTVSGAQMAIEGNVPEGSGLSSSAAIEVASALCFTRLAGVQLAGVDLALVSQRAENTFVGVNSGIMDQFISALGRPDSALLIDTRSLAYAAVPLGLEELDYKLVAVNSAVPRSLITSAYNDRVAECQQAVTILQPLLNLGRGAQLRDVTLAQLEEHKAQLPDLLYRRARHIVNENERVLQAVKLMENGLANDANLSALGRLLYASHASLRDDYEVSSPELDLLVDLARQMPGVVGARMTGAGFGGCTVNIVEAAQLRQFEQTVVARYREQTGLGAEVYVCRAVGGGSYLE